MQSMAQNIQNLFQVSKVLVVDDEYYSRKVIRTLLTAIGVSTIYDADSGAAGLDIIRTVAPDVVLVDWEMPGMDGAAFAKTVRSPGNFPSPNVPIIMLTGHAERWRVLEAVRLGVNEYLLKPVSSKTLLDRLVATLVKPRPIVKVGNYYGPEPRPACPYKPINEASMDEVVLLG
jgi:two-component system chemotaxis response regulator CheY